MKTMCEVVGCLKASVDRVYVEANPVTVTKGDYSLQVEMDDLVVRLCRDHFEYLND